MRASEGAAATAAQRFRVQAKAPPPAAARRRWLLSTGALSRPATVVARSTTSKHRPAVTRRFRERQGDEQGALRLPAAPPSTKKPEVPLSTKKLEVPPSIKKPTSPRRRCPARLRRVCRLLRLRSCRDGCRSSHERYRSSPPRCRRARCPEPRTGRQSQTNAEKAKRATNKCMHRR